MGILDFFKNLFGGGSTETVQETVKIEETPEVKDENTEEISAENTEETSTENNAAVDEEITEEAEEEVDDTPWWEIPAVKDESLQIEGLTNTILYDELSRSLKEDRLEVIELPDNVAAILDIVSRKNFKYPEITNLVEQSPVLTGDFLSISNSAAFSRGISIKNLVQALPRLGKKTIQSILFLNASKMSVPDTPIFKTVAEEIIMESQAVATISRMLAEKYYSDQDTAFLAGLLHNVGKLALLKQIDLHYNLPADYDTEYHLSMFKNIFPIFQHEAGKLIGQYWKLDEVVVSAIGNHAKLESLIAAEVEEKELKLAALVNFSSYIARIIGFGNSVTDEINLFGQQSAEILGFENTPANRNLLNKIYNAIMEAHLDESEDAA